MSNTQLAVSLSKPSPAAVPLLFLEQEEASLYEGRVTKSVLAEAVLGFVYVNKGYSTGNYCGGNSDRLDRMVYAYLYDQTLKYTIDTSYGELQGPIIEELEYVQLVNCSLQDYVELDYPNEGVVESYWETEARTNMGVLTTLPDYEIDKRGVTFTKKVYGTLRIRYKVKRHRYRLTSLSRALENPEVTENKYSAVAYAYWDGGVDWEEMEIPYGFDETNGGCHTDVTINTPDRPYQPPKADKADTFIVVDYCKQEVIYEH